MADMMEFMDRWKLGCRIWFKNFEKLRYLKLMIIRLIIILF